MRRKTKTYDDNTHGIADTLSCKEDSRILIVLVESLGNYEDLGYSPEEISLLYAEKRQEVAELKREKDELLKEKAQLLARLEAIEK